MTEELNMKLQEHLGLPDIALYPALWKPLTGIATLIAGGKDAQTKCENLLLMAGELNHPESRGSVRLASNNPHEAPLIDPNYCGDPRDMEKLRFFVSKLVEIIRRPEISSLLDSVNFPYPTQDVPIKDMLESEATAEELDYHIKRSLLTTWHFSCTARMGPLDDDSCVCDPSLKVKGVAGLRCADASIMPFVNSANTNACCMVIGDKAAEIIMREHHLTERARDSGGAYGRATGGSKARL